MCGEVGAPENPGDFPPRPLQNSPFASPKETYVFLAFNCSLLSITRNVMWCVTHAKRKLSKKIK